MNAKLLLRQVCRLARIIWVEPDLEQRRAQSPVSSANTCSNVRLCVVSGGSEGRGALPRRHALLK